MNNLTFAITAIHANDQTFLFTDDQLYLWVWSTGTENNAIGVYASRSMPKPVRTSIRLEENEIVIKSHRTYNLFAIYTSHQRLILSRALKPSMTGNFSIRDEEGLYDTDPIQAAKAADCCLRSAEFVIEPGFNEPITGVTEVMFSEHTVFFNRGPEYYMYNAYLNIHNMINSSTGVSFRAILHHRQLVYYQLSFSVIPDVVELCKGFVYARTGSVQHILFPTYQGKHMPVWVSFQIDCITLDCIHLRFETLSVMAPDGCLYRYDEATQAMKKTSMKHARVIEIDNTRSQIVYPSKNDLLLIGSVFDLPRGAANGLVAAGFYGKPSFLMVDTDAMGPYMMRNNILCISVRNLVWYRVMGAFVLTYSKDNEFRFYACESVSNPHMKLVSEILTSSHHYYIYSCKGYSKALAVVHAGRDTVMFHTGTKVYAYRFNRQEPGLRTKITLEVDMDHCIDYELVQHNRPQKTIFYAGMDIHKDRLDQLAALVTISPNLTALNIEYHEDSVIKAKGYGVTRSFVYESSGRFSDRFLIHQGTQTGFNLNETSRLGCCLPALYGHALLMGITIAGIPLSVSMPLALFRAIKGRELTDTELEYFAHKANPQAFNHLYPLKYDPEGIEDCGYDSYRQCLQRLTNYDCLTAVENGLVETFCERLATGMNRYIAASNLNLKFERMNAPTLAYWLTGAPLINRKLFKSLLSGSPSLCLLVSNIIDEATEEQLRNLLQNWGGVPCIQSGILYLINTTALDGICYEACFYTCNVSEEFVTHAVKGGMEHVIDLFTTPISSIVDFYGGSSPTLLTRPASTPLPTAN